MQTYFLLRFSLTDPLKFVFKLTFRLFKKINFSKLYFHKVDNLTVRQWIPICQQGYPREVLGSNLAGILWILNSISDLILITFN